MKKSTDTVMFTGEFFNDLIRHGILVGAEDTFDINTDLTVSEIYKSLDDEVNLRKLEEVKAKDGFYDLDPGVQYVVKSAQKIDLNNPNLEKLLIEYDIQEFIPSIFQRSSNARKFIHSDYLQLGTDGSIYVTINPHLPVRVPESWTHATLHFGNRALPTSMYDDYGSFFLSKDEVDPYLQNGVVVDDSNDETIRQSTIISSESIVRYFKIDDSKNAKLSQNSEDYAVIPLSIDYAIKVHDGKTRITQNCEDDSSFSWFNMFADIEKLKEYLTDHEQVCFVAYTREEVYQLSNHTLYILNESTFEDAPSHIRAPFVKPFTYNGPQALEIVMDKEQFFNFIEMYKLDESMPVAYAAFARIFPQPTVSHRSIDVLPSTQENRFYTHQTGNGADKYLISKEFANSWLKLQRSLKSEKKK